MSKTSNRIGYALLFVLTGAHSEGIRSDERISGPSADDTVIIRALEAWEDEIPNVLHFRGDFQLETDEWSISSENATLYGNLDDPESVILTGSPAVFVVRATSQGESRNVSGQALKIVYEKVNNSIRMEGDARLSDRDSTLQGNTIRYEIDRDLINAGGDSGVRIRLDTAGSG